jgi:glycosyltransferase involved in cell wall biosynthesis
MKLLICTQTVDRDDPILGFFHRWIVEFSKHFEHIHVICLREGAHALPSNVSVHSLGKEHGENLKKYVYRFYRTLYNVRGSYDKVFVHMNPHYVILGGVFWRMFGVPIFFWRNHAQMNVMTRIAAVFAQNIFYTSPYACTSRYSHAHQMPVGIDTELFAPKETLRSEIKKVLFLGRLSPIKHVELFVKAAAFLPQGYEFHIYGDDPTSKKEYESTLKKMAQRNVVFHPSVKNYETPEIYRAHDVYVNLTPAGSMDKTVLEAAACGVPVIAANDSFKETIAEFLLLHEPTPQLLAQKIVAVCDLAAEERKTYADAARTNIMERHSLHKLGAMLYTYMHEYD